MFDHLKDSFRLVFGVHPIQQMGRKQQFRAGDKFAWVGIPGQKQDDDVRIIEINSMTGDCEINARILHGLLTDSYTTLITIGVANFSEAVRLGWLVKIN